MPNMTGIVLAKEIMTVRKEMPVILCTGYSETVSREATRKAGIRGFVMKPVTKSEMALEIRRVLEKGGKTG
jgi:two-component system cell cycle sensor histidine kinase/response regulator CckA